MDRAPGFERGRVARDESHAGSAAVLPEAAWSSLLARGSALVVLDYEGTLERFVTARRHARLAPSLARALRRIASSPTDGVVCCSRGPVDAFRAVLSGVEAHLIGENGWEKCTPEGRKVVYQLPGRARQQLESAARAAEACGWGALFVRRRCSLLIQASRLPLERSELLRKLVARLWSPSFETDGLRLHLTPEGPELGACERDRELAIDEVARQLWPSATVVHLAIAPTGPDLSARPSSAQLAGEGAGGYRVLVQDRRDLVRLLEAWPERRLAASAIARRPGDPLRRDLAS